MKMDKISLESKIYKICYWIFMPLAVFWIFYGFNNIIVWKWGLWSQDWILSLIFIGCLMLWLYNIRLKKLEKRVEDMFKKRIEET
jgi:hypothetical protein